ncbi:MAG TPA: MG2 domain-containing protein, partial [Tepidisphaeraceae bacterium]|nr:MG2 domain-containing protein [Tepidisphaeraceae bacterium]
MSHPTGTLAGSRRFWVVVSLFALANLAAWIAYDRFVRPRADVLRIEHFSPGESATLGPATTLAWQFNLEMRDTIDQGTPGAFSPVIAGKWRWDDSRTLTFTPAGNLPKATRVSVTLSPEHLRSAQGFQLAKPFVSTLQTTPLSLISVTQIGFEGDDRAILEMQFSDNVLASDVMKSLSIFGPDAKPLRCELYGQAEGSIVRVVTESIPMLRQASGALSLNVRLAAGLSGTSGPLGLTQMVERSLPISEALFATELNANTPARGDVSLRLRFNGDITPDILHPMLSIEPKIPFQLNPEYHGVQLVGAFQPATRYAITIAKPSASSDPQKYPRGDTLSVFVPDFPPSLWFEHDAGYLGSRGNRTLLAHAINISDIRVSITRVYDNNLVAWRNTGNRFSETLQTDDFAHPIATNKLHLSTKKNQTHDLQIALDDLLPADAAKDGVYRIQIAADDPKKSLPSETDEDNDEDAGQNSASAVVTLSDIGLSAKRTREGLTVWALSLASAKPLAGVRVRAFSDKNQLLGSATTNADGLATIAPIDPASGENCAVVIADRASSDLTWLDLRSSQLNFGNADTTGQPYLQKGHEAFVYTDRGVYRPGETVHLRTIVRGPDNSTPPPFPIRWNILRPDLRNWNSTVTKLDADGNASWDLPLPDDLTTGRWTARVSLPGESEIFGSVTFQVEEFIPDRLKATVKLGHADQTDSPPRLRLADKTIAATIQGDWLFGKPAAGLQTHVVARLDPIPFAPPSWNGWTFGDTADTASVLNEAKPLGHRNEIDTDLLDDHGTAHAPLDLIAMLADTSGQPLHTQSHRSKKTEPIAPTTQSSSPTYPGPWKLTVSASVLEPGGRGVTSNCQADIDVVDRYIAIQSPDLPPKPGETTPIPVALVAPDGSSSNSDATLDAALYRESWNTTLVYKDGHYHYDSSRKLDPVGKPIRATITKGRGEISISPPTSGAYVLRVCDGHNGAITSISFVATFGGWDDNISREDPEKLDLSLLPAPPLSDALRATQPALLAKLRPLILPAMVATTQPTNARKTVSDEFPTDSVAQVLVRSPFAGRLLLSVETDDVISTQVIDMPRSQLLVPIAITGECRPNAYVTATVVRPIDPNAAWRVHRAVGVTRLKIDNTDRRLNIAITAPPEVRPNESLDVRLRITDSTAKPVANAAIQVAAVDEGICQLTNFVTPDPFNFFFTMRALGVTSADLYSDLMPEVARPDKTSAIGGDAGNENEDRHRTPISAKRVRPVALVSGILHTDQNGFAQTSFPLPQFVGKLRVMAVSDAGAKFGCADSDVLVRSPLLVQSSWPRFVAPGDSFSVTLTAFNNTSTIGLTKIAVQILDDSSKLSFDSNGQKQIQLSPITIAANGQSTQTLHLLAGKSAGVAHARVIATLGSETFSETVEIPIRPASPTITTGGFAIATPDSPLPISLPKDMLPGTLSYQLRVTQRPALQLPQ